MRTLSSNKMSPWLASLFVVSLSLTCFALSGCRLTCKDCGNSSVACSTGSCQNSCDPHCYFSFGKYYDRADHCHTVKSARLCAVRDLYPNCSGGRKPFTNDYQAGFIQAYEDVLTGGTGKTPAVPPEKYWRAHYRTAAGHCRANDWFEGYEHGSARVRSKGSTRWTQIPSPNVCRQPPQHTNNVIPTESDFQNQFGNRHRGVNNVGWQDGNQNVIPGPFGY